MRITYFALYLPTSLPRTLLHARSKDITKVGVSKKSIHLFRHTFAKLYILNGGDIFRLQKLLGHSSIEMVREYVEMFSLDLKKDYDDYNSLEQIACNGSYITMR